jgi:hypothetical protein
MSSLPDEELGRREDSESDGSSMYNLGAGLRTGVVMCCRKIHFHFLNFKIA